MNPDKAHPHSDETHARALTPPVYVRWRNPLRTSGGRVTMIDVVPKPVSDDLPLLFVPGWGQVPRTYERTLHIFAAQGRRTLSVILPAFGERVTGESHYHHTQVRKVEVIIGLLARTRIARVDAIAHSEGAVSAVMAAALYPSRFRSVVLVDPGGLIEDDRLRNLGVRFAAMCAETSRDALLHRSNREPVLRATFHATHYMAQHPVRATQEALSLTKGGTVDLLPRLRAGGVRLGVIQGVDNGIFPIEKLAPLVRDGVPLVDGFYAVRGGHAKLNADPRYAIAALDLIDLLNRLPALSAAAGDPSTPTLPPAERSPRLVGGHVG